MLFRSNLTLYLLLRLSKSNASESLTRMLKNKIQLSKFEDLIGLIKQFTNRPASHIASREELQGVVQDKRVFIGRGQGQGSYYRRERERKEGRIVPFKGTSPWGGDAEGLIADISQGGWNRG